ncbi:AraC family transcriptional regulator [Coraliomargarita sp. SDUM461004]|uniref:AraC family transcriptional regulator n=1 Tax=Thalassobacterium sedimentorum TaxID=3041258 RepID=A0ABU1AMS3_9BACT|nr:AraC family transcriptional regulator [Coraliomargarita sp. SDUM461004]MDQ8195513.1 AraC family transcriptional regulator [Coraliomargarita sp. SDUM461004]
MILDVRFSAERIGCERAHSHDYSVLATVEGGTIEMSIADQRVTLEKGMLCLIPSGVTHRVLSTSDDFSGVHTLSLACTIMLSSGSRATTGILASDRGWQHQFVKAMRDFDDADERKHTMLVRSILLFLKKRDVYFSSGCEAKSWASFHWVPTKIKEMIESGADMGSCFQYIEEHMPFSKEHCNRLFKRCYGTTIQGYGLDVRTEKARQLLKRGLLVAESASEAGFYDQSQLTKAFKSIFQLTPAEYRKQRCKNLDQSNTRNL